MSGLDLRTRRLLRAAREDGGSAAAKARIWAELGRVTGAAAGAAAATGGGAGAGAGAAGAAAGTSKVGLVLGVLGVVAATSIGVALLAVARAAEPAPRAVSVSTPAALAGDVPGPAEGVMFDTVARAPRALVYVDADRRTRHVAYAARATPPAPALAVEPRGDTTLASRSPRVAAPATAADSDMIREATMLADARAALRRGEADVALERLGAARLLPHRVLVPEEMSLHARALRLAGDVKRADDVEANLRARFPDHALAR